MSLRPSLSSDPWFEMHCWTEKQQRSSLPPCKLLPMATDSATPSHHVEGGGRAHMFTHSDEHSCAHMQTNTEAGLADGFKRQKKPVPSVDYKNRQIVTGISDCTWVSEGFRSVEEKLRDGGSKSWPRSRPLLPTTPQKTCIISQKFSPKFVHFSLHGVSLSPTHFSNPEKLSNTM